MPINAKRDILFVGKFYEKANLLGYLIIAAAVAAGGLRGGHQSADGLAMRLVLPYGGRAKMRRTRVLSPWFPALAVVKKTLGESNAADFSRLVSTA